MPLTILVTGGAGYIGSHTVLELLNAGHSVICLDNLHNAYCEDGVKMPEALKRVQEITGKSVLFYNVDIRDKEALSEVFKKVREGFSFRLLGCGLQSLGIHFRQRYS